MQQQDPKHDADSGNDGTPEAILQKEKLIDPGNEHTHRNIANDKLPDDEEERRKKHDADAGGDATVTASKAGN